MKKFFALMSAVLVVIGMVFVTGCGSKNENDTPVDGSESNGTQKYFLKHFYREEEYLSFLERFDFENYEVFDVSVEGYGADEYFVTYRTKPTIKENTNISESTITVKEIFQSDDAYVVIANDDTVRIISKAVSKIIVSTETNIVILEKNGDTITKAIFCITQEMFESLN